MASPSQQPSVVVGVEGLDAEAFAELRRANAELAGVGSVDSAHRSHALVVEDTEASVQVLPKTPALAAVKQNGEDQGDVDLALLFRPDTGWRRSTASARRKLPTAALASLVVTSASLVRD